MTMRYVAPFVTKCLCFLSSLIFKGLFIVNYCCLPFTIKG